MNKKSLFSKVFSGSSKKIDKEEHEKIVLGLQYTIAERDRLKLLLRVLSHVMRAVEGVDASRIITAALETPSERYQDIFALLYNKCAKKGFFVEFGACDGLAASNTVILEKNFGWNGLLAEPDMFWRERLKKNRSATIDNRCVSSESGQEIEFFQSQFPGNSSPNRDHNYLGDVVDSYLVETITLIDLLDYHNAPRFIEFLSVDTEGHEKEALENFDFDKYKFGFISVEEHEHVAPENSVQPILEAAGYKVIFPREEGRPIPMQMTGVDKFFVSQSHWLQEGIS